MLTQLEQAALLLASEVENNIRIGVPLTSALVNAVDNFRKIQLTKGSQLDTMIKLVEQTEKAEVIPLFRTKINKNDSN